LGKRRQLGAWTKWGKVWAIGIVDGQRRYWCVTSSTIVRIPGCIAEGEGPRPVWCYGREARGPLPCPRCGDDLARVDFHFHGRFPLVAARFPVSTA
jgi:hypothetical protein